MSLEAIDPADIRAFIPNGLASSRSDVCGFLVCVRGAPGDVRTPENHVAYLLPVVATDVWRRNRAVTAASY